MRSKLAMTFFGVLGLGTVVMPLLAEEHGQLPCPKIPCYRSWHDCHLNSGSCNGAKVCGPKYAEVADGVSGNLIGSSKLAECITYSGTGPSDFYKGPCGSQPAGMSLIEHCTWTVPGANGPDCCYIQLDSPTVSQQTDGGGSNPQQGPVANGASCVGGTRAPCNGEH